MDEKFCSFFMQLSAEVTVIKWLSMCRMKNKEYENMVKRGLGFTTIHSSLSTADGHP